jgi:exocyst complex component 2
LRRIKKRYETDCREYGREPTVAVEEAVAAAKKEADQMFFDVLGRKDRADATRNALNVMNRFDCVFLVTFIRLK